VRSQELAQFRSNGIDGRDVMVPDEERALDVAGLLPREVGDRLDAQRTLEGQRMASIDKKTPNQFFDTANLLPLKVLGPVGARLETGD
jgi:hypothetical protein